MRPPEDVLKTELIGLTLEVTQATNRNNIGINGTIIDETKNTIMLKTKDRSIRLLKNTITFKIKINKKTYQIQGHLLQKRPHERIKIK